MTRPKSARFKRAAQASALALACALLPAAPAFATPTDTSVQSAGAYVDSVEKVNDRQEVVNVYSPSMDRVIPVQVILPADNSEPRPALYLLNGAGGGQDSATWDSQTDAVEFFGDKNVNVITPIGGRFSYYTDWINDDPNLGRNKWQTFLNEELPPVIEGELGANGKRSLSAISMTGTTVLNLAIAKPGFWSGVAGYSGCAQTSDPVGQAFIKTVVEVWGGAESVENMWGPLDGPLWHENDPLLNAEKLRGTQIYLSSGNGLPGYPHDTPANPRIQDGRAAMFDQIVIGSPIEMATNFCTANMGNRLAELGIPATVVHRNTGTHSWGYWEDDLHDSWGFLANSLGM